MRRVRISNPSDRTMSTKQFLRWDHIMFLYICLCILFSVSTQRRDLYYQDVTIGEELPNHKEAISRIVPQKTTFDTAFEVDESGQVIVVESAGYHDEVTASFLYAMRRYEGPIMTRLFLDRFNSSKLFAKLTDGRKIERQSSLDVWNPKDQKDSSGSRSSEIRAVISVTCEKDLEKEGTFFATIFESTNAKVLCVIHHGDSRWNATSPAYARAEKWLASGRLEWITLGKHVAASLIRESDQSNNPEQSLSSDLMLHGAPVHVWTPIFALNNRAKSILDETKSNIEVVIQGKVELGRRSYSKIFEEWRTLLTRSNSNTAVPRLRILGKVLPGRDLKLSDDLRTSISILKNLDYLTFYESFEGAQAIIPAFSDDDYYINKASSTVAASLITGIPMIAEKRMLDSYTYLDESNIYLRQQGESEIDTLKRILPSLRQEYPTIHQNIIQTRLTLLKKNENLIKRWIE